MNATNTIPATSLIEKIHAARRALRDRNQASRAEEITKSFALVRAEQWIEDHKAVDTGFVVRVINVIANSPEILDIERAEIRSYLFSVLLGTAPDGICYRHAKFLAHYLNCTSANDWIDYISMGGSLTDDDTPPQVDRVTAERRFADAVAEGLLVAMSNEEITEAMTVYADAELPNMAMTRADWIEAVWEDDDDVQTEEQAVAKVAEGIRLGQLVPTGEVQECGKAPDYLVRR